MTRVAACVLVLLAAAQVSAACTYDDIDYKTLSKPVGNCNDDIEEVGFTGQESRRCRAGDGSDEWDMLVCRNSAWVKDRGCNGICNEVTGTCDCAPGKEVGCATAYVGLICGKDGKYVVSNPCRDPTPLCRKGVCIPRFQTRVK